MKRIVPFLILLLVASPAAGCRDDSSVGKDRWFPDGDSAKSFERGEVMWSKVGHWCVGCDGLGPNKDCVK